MGASDDFFSANYTTIVDYPLTGRVVYLDANSSTKQCRFCGKSEPETTFRKKAHAVSEMLGNQALRSLSECDACNSSFGKTFENHLAKAILFERAVTGMRGGPTYAEGNRLRIEWQNGRQKLLITDPDLFESVTSHKEPFSLAISLQAESQPFVPGFAMMAFLKMACSLCPLSLVPQIQPTIDWITGRATASLSSFPVYHTFAHGDNPYGNGRAMLLKRTGTQAMPFLWCIIATKNHRFQYFVPFSTEDQPLTNSGHMSFRAFHYPNWIQDGKIELDVWNWASTQTTRRLFDVDIRFQDVELMNRG